jgi:hypothetical protein
MWAETMELCFGLFRLWVNYSLRLWKEVISRSQSWKGSTVELSHWKVLNVETGVSKRTNLDIK